MPTEPAIRCRSQWCPVRQLKTVRGRWPLQTLLRVLGSGRHRAIALHLCQLDGLNPRTSTTAVYLYVDDAPALYAEWAAARVDGRLREPVPTQYGLIEGGYVDPNGNLLHFGSPASQCRTR